LIPVIPVFPVVAPYIAINNVPLGCNFADNLDEWLEENKERNKEIDKRQLYQKTAEELSIYKPFYKPFRKIYERNKNFTVFEIDKEYKSNQEDISLLLKKRKSDLNKEEIELLKSKPGNKFSRKSAFTILCNRFKNDLDFPIKIDLTDNDNIQDEFDRFIKQFDKSPESKVKYNK